MSCSWGLLRSKKMRLGKIQQKKSCISTQNILLPKSISSPGSCVSSLKGPVWLNAKSFKGWFHSHRKRSSSSALLKRVASAVRSHCLWLSAVSERSFLLLLFLKSAYSESIAVEPHWSQIRHFRGLLHSLCSTALGTGEEEVPFKKHSQPPSWRSSYCLWLGPAKALSNCLVSLCAAFCVWSSFKPAAPLPGCHIEISLMSELRADLPIGGCCVLSAPLAPATLRRFQS